MNEYGQIAWSKLGYHQDLPGVRDGTLTLCMKMNEEATLPSFLDLGTMGNVSKYSQMFLRKYASNVQSLVISLLSVEQSPRQFPRKLAHGLG